MVPGDPPEAGSPPSETQEMVRELEGLLKSGGLDPGAALVGQWRFHSAFLAPFTSAFADARQRFLADGSGPLAGTVDQLLKQGLAPAEAATAARELLTAAQGLCVAVVAGDHGVHTVPQPFFGHLSPEWRAGASQVLGPQFRDELARALDALAGAPYTLWPGTVAGPALKGGNVRAYWLGLARGCASASTVAGARADARLADLAMWISSAIAALMPGDLNADDHAALARCSLAAGEFTRATAGIAACAAAGGDETVVELLDALAVAACAMGGDTGAEKWLGGAGADLARSLGCAYDAALARLRLVVASGAGDDRLRPAVDALIAANRKLARQALTREPLWQVTAAEAGELVDTAAAADLIGRSPAFVSKRLDARTIPFRVTDGQVRLPKRTLLAWKAALDAHQVLD